MAITIRQARADEAALIQGMLQEASQWVDALGVVMWDESELDPDRIRGETAAGQFFLAGEYGGQAKSVIYDDTTGNLSYAKNGGDAQIFGRIGNGSELDNKDFLIA